MKCCFFVLVVLIVVSSEDKRCGKGWLFNGDESCLFEEAYPRQYVAYKTSTPPKIDGRVIGDPIWDEVAWSMPFMDISGPDFPEPWFTTNMKIRWDDHWLYVAGYVQETEIWAYMDKRNSIIFLDNDFEMFIDPSKTTHYYKEFEMNANNAIWDLCLNKPYSNGGYENSSRVFGDHGFDMKTIRSGVFINGTINDPSAKDYFWTVEIAFPLTGLTYNQSDYVTLPPVANDLWKIDFSRVEYNVTVVNGKYEKIQSVPEQNWVWSPQYMIDMHRPERWGYLQFSDSPINTTHIYKDKEFPIRYIASQLYYANCAYYLDYNKFTDDVDILNKYAPSNTINGKCSHTPKIQLSPDKQSYQSSITSLDTCMTATIDNNRFLLVKTQC